ADNPFMARQALFTGLIYYEKDRLVASGHVGTEAQYIVDDDGFMRHIDSEKVDRQILSVFIQQLQGNKDLAISQAMNFLGKDDLFTKAALDSSIDDVDLDQIIAQGLPYQAQQMMGMMGFKVVIDIHGNVVDMQAPTEEME
ncbi:MAG: hypothetical protein AAF633_23440, partial [Chloroflexota bacterium]